MELVKLMAASLLSAALFCPGWASAQVAVASDELHQPATVQPAASESDNYLSLASQNGQAKSPNNGSATAPGPKADEAAAQAWRKQEEEKGRRGKRLTNRIE